MESKGELGIDPNSKTWVESPDGIRHAVRASEGKHHSAFCGKYVCSTETVEARSNRCRTCLDRLSKVIILSETRSLPRCVILGRSSHIRHNGERLLGG